MKKNIFLQIAAVLIIGFAFMLVLNANYTSGADSQTQKVEGKFEGYRDAIKYAHQIDIMSFKDRIPGGVSDGKPITNYSLKELLEGIKWEREHTNDSLLALEMAMDHLERIPNYYSHLARMEWECAAEKYRGM